MIREKRTYTAEQWYRFSIIIQEKLCEKFDITLTQYIPKNRLVFRRINIKITKAINAIDVGVVYLNKGLEMLGQIITDILTAFNHEFESTQNNFTSSKQGKTNIFAGSNKINFFGTRSKNTPFGTRSKNTKTIFFGTKTTKKKSDNFWESDAPDFWDSKSSKSDNFWESDAPDFWDSKPSKSNRLSF